MEFNTKLRIIRMIGFRIPRIRFAKRITKYDDVLGGINGAYNWKEDIIVFTKENPRFSTVLHEVVHANKRIRSRFWSEYVAILVTQFFDLKMIAILLASFFMMVAMYPLFILYYYGSLLLIPALAIKYADREIRFLVGASKYKDNEELKKLLKDLRIKVS